MFVHAIAQKQTGKTHSAVISTVEFVEQRFLARSTYLENRSFTGISVGAGGAAEECRTVKIARAIAHQSRIRQHAIVGRTGKTVQYGFIAIRCYLEHCAARTTTARTAGFRRAGPAALRRTEEIPIHIHKIATGYAPSGTP